MKNDDFHTIPKYLFELTAEHRLSFEAVHLYGFYRSLAGWSYVAPSEEFIKVNTGLKDVRTIRKCQAELVNEGVIELDDRNHIIFLPQPKRQLKKVTHPERPDLRIPK